MNSEAKLKMRIIQGLREELQKERELTKKKIEELGAAIERHEKSAEELLQKALELRSAQ